MRLASVSNDLLDNPLVDASDDVFAHGGVLRVFVDKGVLTDPLDHDRGRSKHFLGLDPRKEAGVELRILVGVA